MNFVGKPRYQALIIVIMLLGIGTVQAQENEYFDSLLQRVDTIENPVYMPMISVDYGAFIFMGDVKNSRGSALPSNVNPAFGNRAFRVNMSTYLDNRHFFLASFNFLSGKIAGEEYYYGDETLNLNFQNEFIGFGVSSTYHFEHFFRPAIKLKPYVSLGFEVLMLHVRSDYFDAEGNQYYYWSDGSVRNLPEAMVGSAIPLVRDYEFETGQDELSFGIPLGIGFAMKVSDRVTFGMGAEYHYSFTDLMDNSSVDNSSLASKGNDGFLFTKASLQVDLFSEPKTRTVDLLYADLEMDAIFYDDEDGDFILDHIDRCPGTPYGILVDSLGCPFDSDADGIPDYMDREADTAPGAWVDDNGVTVSEADFLYSLQRDSALNREDLEAYMQIYSAGFIKQSIDQLPEKFESLDADEDGYISFDELLLVIDDYFDFKVNLSLEELRELNEFFFSQ